MKLATDTLTCVKLMIQRGLTQTQAEAVVSTFSETEVNNLLSAHEVDQMIGEATQKVFDKSDRRFEATLQRMDKRLDATLNRVDDKYDTLRREVRHDIRSQSRWLISTMIGCSAALASLHLIVH